MADFDLVAPRTVEEATAALAALPAGEALPLGGGTDLLLDVENGRLAPRRLVSLRHLPWRSLDWTDGGLTIGSTLPLRSLELDPRLPAELPGLYEAVRAVGGVALRSRATLGGNLGRAAPASDLIPVLLALDGEIDIVGPRGARRVPVDAFVRRSRETALGRAELVRAVRLPEARPSAYVWQRVRPVNDISQVAVAVAYARAARAWRVAVGGVPPRPLLIPDAGAALGAGRPGASDVERASRAVHDLPGLVSDRRATEEYRRHLAATLLRRAVTTVVARGGGAR